MPTSTFLHMHSNRQILRPLHCLSCRPLAGYSRGTADYQALTIGKFELPKEKAGVPDLFQSRHLRIAHRDIRFAPGNTNPGCAWFPPGRFELFTVRVVPNRFKVYIAQQ
jgi:hypothetical protein